MSAALDSSPRRPERRPTRAPDRSRGALVAWAAIALSTACAGPATERNLAPFFSSHSAAGGVPEVEALGGAVVTRKDPESGDRRYWAVRPILSNRSEPNGDRKAWFIPPFGQIKEDASEQSEVSQFIPLVRYASQIEDDGFETWSLLVLPGIYLSSHEDGRVQRAFFPFGGVVEKFLSLDRGTFVLFPLWLRTERYGRTTDHFLWPFFSFSRGAGGNAWRVWPLAGNVSWDGRYDRWFFLWPFFHWQRNDVQYGAEQTRSSWMFWPLGGQARREQASSTSVLWPIFGYAHDERSGFWAWDGPWPLVVFQGGDPERAKRKRVWPFYSSFEGDGMTSQWVAWPLVNWRHEEYEDGTKDAFKAFPLWRSYTRERTFVTPQSTGPLGTERYRKVWPFGRIRTAPELSDVHVVDLNPFPDYEFVDEHYAWLWELYTRRRDGEQVRGRSWLGLWRREKDADEDRRSLSGLWSARDYTRAGRPASERSFLFGLLRYRTTEAGGFEWLRPSFPGPGWPMRRTPSSATPAIDAAPLVEAGAVASPVGANRLNRPLAAAPESPSSR